MKQWKTLSRKTVLPWNEFLTVESHDIQLPDGSVIERWPWGTKLWQFVYKSGNVKLLNALNELYPAGPWPGM
jgi:hypothetical protein